ncbi:TetR/AcrR family transcriptional regulator [Achromobacter sp. AONIH1]|uniref:TetR/AcrR family transcriptional regulator n=1 Tax=unclassified Achromobacter TaxID=2626865 RepID=UPI000CD1E44E|nr:TetR/AcrR family transcriptional regulator [Achromobacter sp. AONIH1]AUT48538.1 TetR family transcriptional regulator [Achromobacter sp. AONIH1]
MPDRTTDTASASRARGRPREFDMEQALDRAVDVFSQRGYHGTSIGDLARGTELAQGSLYKAFKDKHALFLAALDHYRARRVEGMARAIGAGGSGRERLRRLLAFYAESSQGRQGRQGCLVVESAAELSFFDEDVAERVTTALGRNEALLAGLIREGQEDGSLAAHIDPADAARMLLCLVQGMRVVGKTGRRRQDMLAVVDMALKALE